MEFKHKTVLLNEAVNALNIKPNGVYIDGTAGGGGHSAEILEHLDNGKLICIDRDPDAIETLNKRFKNDTRVVICNRKFSEMKSIIRELSLNGVDGVVLDLGVSSHQLDDVERGFSYHGDASLDMRMSKQGTSAADLVNNLSPNELVQILLKYGEEKYAVRIVREIVNQRSKKSITKTNELAEIVKSAYPAAARRDGHPARKTFQALRIAVNGEIEDLIKGLDSAFEILNCNGRISVITFHSIEDRTVKHKMADWCKGCICPKDFPVCVCGRTPAARLVIRKPLEPSKDEIAENRRSRSARLRACEKIHDL